MEEQKEEELKPVETETETPTEVEVETDVVDDSPEAPAEESVEETPAE